MKPSNKNPTRLKRTTPKKQKSILSFFSTSATRPNPSQKSPSPSSWKPLGNPQSTPPSTTASLDEHKARNLVPPSPGLTSAPSRLHSRITPSPKICRELFAEQDTEPAAPKLKKRRILRLEDYSDDDSTEPLLPRSKCVNIPKAHCTSAEQNPPQELSSLPNVKTDGDKDMALVEDEPSGTSDVEMRSSKGNIAAFQYDGRDGANNMIPVKPSAKRSREAREKLGALSQMEGVGKESEGWCGRHPWSINVRDAKKRAPDHPDYDKTTLFVPQSAFMGKGRGCKSSSLSPFQSQFWSIKKANYDVIIFFKKGKFYELYDVDADVGHQQLGLNFTKGGRVDMRCCGVPEQSLEKHCGRLVDLGYKVGRVEQTETASAAEKRKNGGGSNTSSVCGRALVRIFTKGTVTEDGLLRDHRARHILSLYERQNGPQSAENQGSCMDSEAVTMQNEESRTFGVCFVDVASGIVTMGEFSDDSRIAKTERLMTFLRPYELIVDLSIASPKLKELVHWLGRSDDTEVIDISRSDRFSDMTKRWLGNYLKPDKCDASKNEYERVCNHLQCHPLSASAFGAMASHLKCLMIDKETLSLGNYKLFPTHALDGDVGSSAMKEPASIPLQSKICLGMDAPTLQNLEVLSSSGASSDRGSLLSFLDKANTPAGRRLIRKWVAEPLTGYHQITDRLQAIEDIHKLEDEKGGSVLNDIVRHLKTKKDLERALPKLHRLATVDDGAVMFDDTDKRKVKDFVFVLRSLESSLKGLEMFQTSMESSPPNSKRLAWISSADGAVPKDAALKLQFFLGEAFDVEQAEMGGLIVPNEGAVPHYDERKSILDAVESELENELMKWKKSLRDSTMKFYHRGKEPYQMEVNVKALQGGVPGEFELVSESKNVKRFYTGQIRRLIRNHVTASEAYTSAAQVVTRDMIRQFDLEYNTWASISNVCAELDALIGLATVSRGNGTGPMCRPQILPDGYPEPVFEATELRHPILAASSDSFVSNDVNLGGAQSAKIMILSGPNAGGKSTLARQVGIAVILAQLGCFVPAKSLRLRPFHDVFVRMGASDDLSRGRSTFMVEMEEVGHILNHANSRSLIIADEVGRGTSTHDGYAVAAASLKHIAAVNKSLTVFSTHYCHLGDELIGIEERNGKPIVAVCEMSAVVDEIGKRITFLYKLKSGQSGHSRGIYCARVAGIPEIVATNAEEASNTFDRRLLFRLASKKFCSVVKMLDSHDKDAIQGIEEA